jgi:hypothetical protein
MIVLGAGPASTPVSGIYNNHNVFTPKEERGNGKISREQHAGGVKWEKRGSSRGILGRA